MSASLIIKAQIAIFPHVSNHNMKTITRKWFLGGVDLIFIVPVSVEGWIDNETSKIWASFYLKKFFEWP